MSIVPATRLLWLVFYTVLVGVGVGPFPELVPVWVLAIGVVVIAALIDLAVSLARAAPPRVSIPGITRFMRDREGAIRMVFDNPAGRHCRVRVGLGLPAGFVSREEERWIDLPAGATRSQAVWPCTPRRRGRFATVQSCVEGDSVLGLWRVRFRSELPTDLRVHPNLFAERKHVAALFLARGRAGVRLQRTLGRGREFEKLRDYLPGDGFDEIHWKATAKRGRPITKVFQAERTQEIYVVLDASRLSARPLVHGGVEQTVLERYVTSAMVLLLAAGRQGDKFGLIAHDDRVRIFVRAGTGARHYAACRDSVLSLRPSEATPDVPEIVRSLRMRLRQRALLFFLTDMTDPVLKEDFVRNVRVLSRQHLVLVGLFPPPEVRRLFDGSEVRSTDDVYARLAGHARWKESRSLAQQLRPLGVTTVTLENETMAAQLVSQYMQIKAKQAL
jgi:uncharacterized protein (DUF58 family)